MSTAEPATQPELLAFDDAGQWEAWLAEHEGSATEVWLRIAKKGHAGLGISDALDVALCFGWIDSHRRGNDESSFRQRYSPRRAGSPWSQVNVEKAAALESAGRIRAGGRAQIEAAKADGRWDAAYARQRDAVVPDDLAAALAASPRASARFDALGKTDRYAIILSLAKARTAQGRATRLERALAELGAA
ncbi:YdeI/OmpD-associated family protein [Agromyces soli]